MNKIVWRHLITRRLSVQTAIAWNYGFTTALNQHYQTGINNTLTYYNGKKTDYFVDNNELLKLNTDLDALLKKPECVKSLMPEAKEFLEQTYNSILKAITGAGAMPDKRLADIFSEFSKYHMNYYTRMWMVFRISERIILNIEALLGAMNLPEEEVKEITRVLSIPLIPNDVINERIDLLKIALLKDNTNMKEMNVLLKKHTEQYQHIPMFGFDHEPYTMEHFAKELEMVREPHKELAGIKESFKCRKKEFEAVLTKLNPTEELNNLIMMLKDAVVLRDYRDMIRQKMNLALSDFYREIGARIGLTLKETALLTNEEIEDHLAQSKQFSNDEIAKRKESFLLIQKDKVIVLYSGAEARRRAEGLQLYKPTTLDGMIQGRPASPGKVQGIARIVHTNLDLKKVQEGDILVAPMTRQDFVPVMRKTAAIVTNEGGVTCHAAIICRELGIPCVVGTQNATEMLHDGDLIEVDAATGIIRKIKRKSNI